MRTLGIDTSNYATSLAVFDTNAGEVVCDCKRFLPVREGQLGLRQSDALFHHTAALPEMLAELGQKVNLTQIEAVGVSARPRPVDGSYMPCFFGGRQCGHSVCAAKAIPLVQTTHQQGHISAALLRPAGQTCRKEELVFHVSGGTTDLLHCKGPDSITCIGTSSDLYAGQAVDRLGVRLGYALPGGHLCQPAGGSLHREHQTQSQRARHNLQPFRLAEPVRKAAGRGQKPGICQ